MSENTEIMKNGSTAMAGYDPNVAYGFEETDSKDIIIPRIKDVQALSPERHDGEASEGDIINSLTKESVKGLRFIPIKQYYSNINWNPDRGAELRMLCRSLDGRVGQGEEGSLVCAQCKKNQFDNTKTGRDAQPVCTSYLNFLGFFEGNPMPVVLSFARTNYNEGKKMLSIARSMRCAAWNYAYTLDSKQETKDKNKWFIMVPKMAGETSAETRALAFELFKAYERTVVNADYEDVGAAQATEVDATIAEEI
jgi:hypothetical protein